MLTHIAVFLTLAAALAGQAIAAPVPMESKPPAELLKTQRDAARTVYEMLTKGQPQVADPEMVYLWSRRWMEAERQLAGDRSAERAAVAAHLDRMKKGEDIARARLAVRVTTTLPAAMAAFYLAEAEAWLAQLKGK